MFDSRHNLSFEYTRVQTLIMQSLADFRVPLDEWEEERYSPPEPPEPIPLHTHIESSARLEI